MSYSYRVEPIDEWYTLYKKYKPYLFKRLKQLSAEDREDVYQDLFISLSNARKSYNPNAGRSKATWFFFYLKSLVNRALIRYYRQKEFIPLDKEDDDSPKLELIQEPNMEKKINSVDLKKTVNSLLKTIPVPYAEIIRSYYGIGVQQKTQTKLAEERKCSPANIRDMLFRAERYLKSRIRTRGINVGELLDYDT